MIILIVEDDKQQLRKLTQRISDYFPDATIKTAKNIDEAKYEILNAEYDLGIFDILIEGKSIFEWLFGADLRHKQLIFITGSDNFIKQAFECYAVDYLIKPYEEKRLINSVKLAIHRNKSSRFMDEMQDSRYNMLNKALHSNVIDKIAIPDLGGLRLLKLNDIVAVEAARAYCTFHMTDGELVTVSKSLSWAEQRLNNLGFYRPHRSWLVNNMHVRAFIKKNGYSLELTAGLFISISDNAKNRIINWLKEFSIID